VRVAVYSDFAYRRRGDAIWAEQAFVLFAAGLADCVDELLLVGRLDPEPGRWHYRLPRGVELVPLPHYGRLSNPLRALAAMLRSLGRFWRLLGRVDCVWLMGPHPLSIAFALLAALRGRRVALGVRQDFPEYVRTRHPGARVMRTAAVALERMFRLLGRATRVVAVGPQLAANYARTRRLLEISVSLVPEGSIVSLEQATSRRFDGELRVLSVGRLDPEKNPLLLADVLAALDRRGGDWRLVVCGEGALEDELRARIAALELSDRAELRGYVSLEDGLPELYRQSHVLLHVSWTEGMPQVLLEAFAAGLPVVATAVGGVEAAVGDAALLIPPGDARAAAEAVARLAGDSALRQTLVERGLERVRGLTLESQCRAVARFLAAE
jgi:glycosyltransferase involved in cell wall biosynthesis